MFITSIEYGANAHTCACGNGCSNSFPANWCKAGMEFRSISDFWEWTNFGDLEISY